MNIFTVSLMNRRLENKQEVHRLSSMVCMSNSENEAIGEAIQANDKAFPFDEGWNIAQVTALRCPIISNEPDCCDDECEDE